MKRIISIAFICFAIVAQAQYDNRVLLSVGGDEVSVSDFMNVYRKNQGIGENTETKSLSEYLELYINFKLKVREARALGLDTLPSFKKELAGYRRQLAKPYLVDREVRDHLVKEAYERMKSDVNASHILFNLKENADPKDTLNVYKEALKVRDRVLKGENFETLAREFSGDRSVSKNGGNLGYFTAFNMLYSFESAAYDTPKDKVSMPVRTRYGYHLVKVHDKRPARGKVKVAHIMVISPEGDNNEKATNAEQKVKEIYQKLQDGEDFATLAKQFSEDKNTSYKGGELDMFGINVMVGEFEDAAFGLKNIGDYSAPIRTKYGWHIIKLLDKKDLQSFEEIEYQLKAQIEKDSRSQLSRKSIIRTLKEEYQVKEINKELRDYYKLFPEGKMDAEKAAALDATLFVIDGKAHSQKEFTPYLQRNVAKIDKDQDIRSQIDALYQGYLDNAIISYENSRLEEKYPEFRLLISEYRDGILLFELTDEKVWSKAVKDSSGLAAFHESNKDRYMWEKRVDASIYSCIDEKVAKKAAKYAKKGKAQDWILEKLNKDSQLNVSIERELYEKGNHPLVDQATWEEGASEMVNEDERVKFVYIHELLDPQHKSLDEAKGLIISDYQNYLEKEWIEELKGKYKVVVNKDILNTLQ